MPASITDTVPRFVLEQALAMVACDSNLSIVVLAPHTPASHGRTWPQRESDDGRVTQHRFRYALRCWETLTYKGILPSVKECPVRVFLLPIFMLCQFFALWSLVKREKPDVIYAHWFTPQALTACAVSRLTGVPFGFTTHASDVIVWRRFGYIGRWIVCGIVRQASFMSAVSKQTAEKLLVFFSGDERKRMANKLHIIPMGVTINDALWPPGDPCRALIVARLVEKKGIHLLIDAWPSVLNKVPNAVLTIAGNGPLRNTLANHARTLGVDVAMPGFVAGIDKHEVMAAAGVVIQPSVVGEDGDADGMPVALLEGMAAGRIGVASDASGAQDWLVDGINGFLVPSGDADVLAKAIVDAMSLAPKQRARMLEEARKVMISFAWPVVAQQHLAMIGTEKCHS